MTSEENANHEGAKLIDTTITKVSLQAEKLIPQRNSYGYSPKTVGLRGTIKLP